MEHHLSPPVDKPGSTPAIDTKSPGQLDYEADLARRPTYHDGTPRKQWHELDAVSRWSWERGAQKS